LRHIKVPVIECVYTVHTSYNRDKLVGGEISFPRILSEFYLMYLTVTDHHMVSFAGEVPRQSRCRLLDKLSSQRKGYITGIGDSSLGETAEDRESRVVWMDEWEATDRREMVG
jgi:hypothetical protein